MLCSAQLPGAPHTLATDGLIGINSGIERDRPIPGHEQGEAELAQSKPLLLGGPPRGERGALVAARQRRKKVRGVVAERIE